MSTPVQADIADMLAQELDVPDTAYQAAARRYEDLGTWLHNPEHAECADYGPEVSCQGSFRLGTTVRPWKQDDYDLDMACTLTRGLGKGNIPQEKLKSMLGRDLEKYRRERGVKEALEAKHRCWRMYYQDNLSFHMDSVPGIPADDATRALVEKRMVTAGRSADLASQVAQLAVSITDDRHPSYRQVSDDWLISNPEGYAKWFEFRMRAAREYLQKRAFTEAVASIDDLPAYQWKSPLQRSVQILKRHRDIMFERDPDSKPASVILTTLAGHAYQGEPDIDSALRAILDRMGQFVREQEPRVPNPVNPAEDFADRWSMPEGLELGLETKFWAWLEQARADYGNLVRSRDAASFVERAASQYGCALREDRVQKVLGTAPVVAAPQVHTIRGDAPKPWRHT